MKMPFILTGAPAGVTCSSCEYFDGEYGDCLNRNSPRFQTEAQRDACPAYFPETAYSEE